MHSDECERVAQNVNEGIVAFLHQGVSLVEGENALEAFFYVLTHELRQSFLLCRHQRIHRIDIFGIVHTFRDVQHDGRDDDPHHKLRRRNFKVELLLIKWLSADQSLLYGVRNHVKNRRKQEKKAIFDDFILLFRHIREIDDGNANAAKNDECGRDVHGVVLQADAEDP